MLRSSLPRNYSLLRKSLKLVVENVQEQVCSYQEINFYNGLSIFPLMECRIRLFLFPKSLNTIFSSLSFHMNDD